MPLSEEMKLVIQKGANTDELKHAMDRMEMPTLFKAAVTKVLQQITTVEELLRVVPPTK